MAKGKGGKKNATKHKQPSNRASDVSAENKHSTKNTSSNNDVAHIDKDVENTKPTNNAAAGKIAPPIVEAPKEQRKYSRRVLTSNWEKYVEPEVDPHEVEEEGEIEETKEFSYLLQNAGAVTSHFKFEDERKLDEEMQKTTSEETTSSQGALGLNLNILSSELADIGLQKKLNLSETVSNCSYCFPSAMTAEIDVLTTDKSDALVGDSEEPFVWCYEGLEQCKSLLERTLKWPQKEKGEKSWEDLEFDDMVIVDDVAVNNNSQPIKNEEIPKIEEETDTNENTFSNIQTPVSPVVEEWSTIEQDLSHRPTLEAVDTSAQGDITTANTATEEEEDIDDFLDELLSGGVQSRSVVIDPQHNTTSATNETPLFHQNSSISEEKDGADNETGLTDSQISSMADSAVDFDSLLCDRTENLSISASKSEQSQPTNGGSQSDSKSNDVAKQQDLDDWLDSMLD